MKKLLSILFAVLVICVSLSLFGCGEQAQYTITFDTVGGSEIAPITQDYNTAVTPPQNPTKVGYTFNGWDKDIPEKMPAENVKITAKWTINEYDLTINYYYAGTTNVASAQHIAKVAYGSTYSVDSPSVTGYTADQLTVSGTMDDDETVTVYYYTTTYSITYLDAQCAENTNPTSYKIESETITLADLSKIGYTFNGWYNGTEKVTEIAKGSTGDLVLTAKWTRNEYDLTINYYYAGTTNVASAQHTAKVAYGSTYSVDSPSVTGYTADQLTVSGTMDDNDVTITVYYSLTTYTITYENTKDANNTNPTSYTIESDTITLVNLSRENYKFDGWYNGTTKVTEIAKGSTGNLTLTAKWTKISIDMPVIPL